MRLVFLFFSVATLVSRRFGDAFQVPPSASSSSTTTRATQPLTARSKLFGNGRSMLSSPTHLLFAASDDEDDDDGTSSKRLRKRKRKQASTEDASPTTTTTPAPPTPVMELTPRDDTPVQLEIKNVKDLVGGGRATSSSATATMSTTLSQTAGSLSSMRPSSLQFPSSRSGNKGADAGLEDSLEQLLEDARRMKEEDGGGSGDSAAGGLLSDEEGTGLKEIIRNVLSTIVTADFFVVCGFLLWFLAGIFWRAVFDDDSVQIAFNNNFETLVQPALGILMIAALAGNFFKDDEETDMMA